MYWITIDQIQSLKTVIEEGSFTRASEKLNKAKSAIRYSVNNLEEQLGFKVFDRSTYRPSLTNQGKDFINEAKKLLTQYENLLITCDQISEKIETRLSLSVTGIFEMDHVYQMIKKAMNQFPKTEIVLEREILSGERMILDELVDLAIFESPQEKKKMDCKLIGQVQLKLVISGDHTYLELPKKQQNFDRLLKFPRIIQRSTITNEESKDRVYEKALKWKVTDTPSKKQIILNGLGWGRLPADIVSQEIKEGKLVHLSWLNDDDQVKIYLCKRKNSSMGRVAKFFWESF